MGANEAREVGSILNERDRRGVIAAVPRTAVGFPVGIVAIRLPYPKLPGNVVNASTFDFPVMYEEVVFDVEQLFAGDSSIRDTVVDAARALEARGARVIVGACGFFAHFQEDVAAAVGVPAFMSSLVQVPLVLAGLRPGQRVLVFAADGPSVDAGLLAHVGVDPAQIEVVDLSDRPAFAPIRRERTVIDNGALIDDLRQLVVEKLAEHDDIGAVLLECSDLPPYAADIQAACGLPVFDFITLINWAHQAVAQRPYYGDM